MRFSWKAVKLVVCVSRILTGIFSVDLIDRRPPGDADVLAAVRAESGVDDAQPGRQEVGRNGKRRDPLLSAGC